MDERQRHIEHLRRTFQLARQALARGDMPFGAVLAGPEGEVLMEQGNVEVTENRVTGHADCALAERAARAYDKNFLQRCTMYINAVPCIMCMGAIYWAGIGTVAYAISERRLLDLNGKQHQAVTINVDCHAIFAAAQRPVRVLGPFPEVEAEAAAVHAGFNDPNNLENLPG